MFRILFLLTGLLATFMGLAGCETPPRHTPSGAPLVQTQRPTVQSVPLWLEATGTAEAVRTVNFVPRVAGTLQTIGFVDGETVSEGSTLFVIDPAMFQARQVSAEAAVFTQQAALNRAQVEYDRNMRLYVEKAMAQTDVAHWRELLAAAQGQLREAEAALVQANLELGYATLTAPFTGRITRHTVDTGNVVGPQSAPLATLVAVHPIHALFAVNARELLARFPNGLPNGTALELAIGDGPFTRQGTLDYSAPLVNQGSGTLTLRGLFANEQGGLLPGLFVRVRLKTEQLPEALLVPTAALLEDQGGVYVLTVNGQGTAERRNVRTGPEVDSLTVILEGLAPENEVIVAGQSRVRPGGAVTVAPRAAAGGEKN